MQMSWMETTSNPDVLKALQTATDLALRALWVMRCLHLWSRSAISSCVWPKWGMPSKFGSSVPVSQTGLFGNAGESKLSPTQGNSFLSMELDSVTKTARLIEEHVRSVLNCLKSAPVEFKQFQRLLRYMAAAFPSKLSPHLFLQWAFSHRCLATSGKKRSRYSLWHRIGPLTPGSPY